MHITSKSRYAIKVMLDIAAHEAGGIVQRKDVCTRQGLSLEYLDQILMRLRKAELVASVRGPQGGYRLKRGAQSISVWEIFEAVEDTLYPVGCVSPKTQCDFQDHCDAQGAWEQIFAAVFAPLNKMKLQQLLDAHGQSHVPLASPSVCCSGGAVHG